MLPGKGIVRKTFLFSALLITIVTLVSFAILYVAMPGFYQYKKEKTFHKNLDALVSSLQEAATQEEYVDIISEFSGSNNANVFSFDANGDMLPTASTPFLSVQGGENAVFFSTKGIETEGRTTFSVIVRQRLEDSSGQTEAGMGKAQLAIRSFNGKSSDILSLRGEIGTPIVDHILVDTTLQPIDEAKDVILSLIPYLLMVGIALGLLLAWVYARQISKPILQISEATEKMQRMEPDAGSGIRSDDELGLLSRNLDALYTSLRKNIENLQLETDKASRLERSKTEMMQSASHELKTPIAALNGMLEGMLDHVGVYKDRGKYLVECKGEVQKLSLLVDEIISASKSDALGEALDFAGLSVDGLAERVLREYAVQIHENALNVTTALMPVTITTDEAVLYRSISNMLSNAVRYTEPGGELRIDVFEDEAGKWFTIENQCEAIPADEIAKLFEPFYTRSYSRDKQKSGTGLGLYIVKRNLERLGISYTAENGELGLKISLKLNGGEN